MADGLSSQVIHLCPLIIFEAYHALWLLQAIVHGDENLGQKSAKCFVAVRGQTVSVICKIKNSATDRDPRTIPPCAAWSGKVTHHVLLLGDLQGAWPLLEDRRGHQGAVSPIPPTNTVLPISPTDVVLSIPPTDRFHGTNYTCNVTYCLMFSPRGWGGGT